ncbi:uncharacterized protein LOC105664782 [Ceratitis capitata]|uniref:uncharacterized protein LOC105664782 n=1 Tax=Ceratitis capitata TaxID=7213 RepID=UPI000A117597|nr:uncharacterized protein LOC105664782 [Ceratitis capitata]
MNGQAYHFGKSDSGGGFDVDMLTNINDDATVDNVYNIAAELANAGSVVDGSRHIGINDEEAAAAEVEAEDEDNNADNDILMLLNGEQDVMKFLSWAMQQLYTYQHLAQLSNGSGRAESYHPGMFNWKKLNLSGHLEPPLSVEEPQYVIVRREQLDEDLTSGYLTEDPKPLRKGLHFQNIFNFNHAPQYKDDPFIPPRGRKHNLPDLDALLNRYETFVPNRGKRDKIKDIFKYDDLFFPNRGKKQKPPKAVATTPQRAFNEEAIGLNSVDSAIDDAEGEKGKQLLDNHVDGNDDSNLTAPPVTNAMRRVLGELDKRLRWRQSRNCSTLVNVYGGAREDCDNEDDDDVDDAVDTLRIGIDKNSDDNSNNYSDTIDSNVVMSDDGAGSGEGVAEAIAIVAALNENDHSPVKSSLLQIDTRDAMSDVVMTTKRPTVGWRGTNMYSRLRRVPSSYGGATRIAANRLRSLLSSAAQSVQRQQMNRATNQQQQQQQTSMKATPRYHGRQLRQEQVQQEQHHQQQRLQLQKKQAQRRASWLMALPSNQVRVNTNDLEALTWRQLQRKPQQQQQKQLDNNKPLTVQHPALAWLQHLPVQKTESQQQIQHGLFGSSGVVNGAAAERKPLESTDHIYFNI